MPSDDNKARAPQGGPAADEKKPSPSAKVKGADREARLADALRANLRRRKADPQKERKDD